MDDEPVIYRPEVLTVMAVLGDIRHDVRRLIELLEEDDGEEEDPEDD